MKFGLAAMISVAAVVVGCSSSPHDERGDLAVEVLLPHGIVFDSITYRVSGGGAAPIVQDSTISGSPTTTSALFVGLPARPGYEIVVTASSTDRLTVCASSARADVRANRTTNISIPLACARLKDGTVSVVATLACSQISAVVAAPAVTSVGGEVELQAEVTASDGGMPTFAWTATSGTFSDAAAAITVFTCATPGPASITVTATNGQCSDHVTLTVTCVPASG